MTAGRQGNRFSIVDVDGQNAGVLRGVDQQRVGPKALSGTAESWTTPFALEVWATATGGGARRPGARGVKSTRPHGSAGKVEMSGKALASTVPAAA